MTDEILVCAKTYPNLSNSHKEVMCTAGIDKNGNWKRIYPINYRQLPKAQKFKKYQWIYCNVLKDKSDPRIESHKISDDFIPSKILDTKHFWLTRKNIINKSKLYCNMKDILEKARIGQSLFTFKPKTILDCIIKADYTKEISAKYEVFLNSATKNLIKQIPYKVYYKFKDCDANISTLQIIDWELYQFMNKLCVKYKYDDSKIASAIKTQYFDNIAIKRDVYLFLGTNKYWHIRKSKNPLMIIGIFYPPKVNNDIN